MSNEIKPMTVVVIAIMPDGSTRMKVEGRSSVADILLASKYLELEAADAFSKLKVNQAIAAARAERGGIVQAPAGALEVLNGKG